MDIKVAIALVSIAMTIVGYSYYFRDIFKGKTKPHAYSWLVWALLTAFAFLGQLSENAGPGAYVTGVTATIAFIVFFLALNRGEKDITRFDRVNLAAALLALIPWLLTNNPTFSIILITLIDVLGFMPTIRKSWHKPYEETLIAYVFAGVKFVLAIIALENYSLVTWLYPASLVVTNLFFVIMLIVRRKQLGPLQTYNVRAQN
ncbi:MAG: hypothetical protein WAS36_04570 [Candidatus Saccharimonadales bacterium]